MKINALHLVLFSLQRIIFTFIDITYYAHSPSPSIKRPVHLLYGNPNIYNRTRKYPLHKQTFWQNKKESLISQGFFLNFDTGGRGRTGTPEGTRFWVVRVCQFRHTGIIIVERKTGFEPATPTLARWCSTTELLPQNLYKKKPDNRFKKYWRRLPDLNRW